MPRFLVFLATILGAHGVAAAQAAGDVDAGMVKFVQACSGCHSIEPDRNRIGPSLHGVVGRTAGSTAGFDYSPELARQDFDWTVAVLQEYLTTPTQSGGGDQPLVSVHMTFSGLSSSDTDDLIAFLDLLRRD